MSKENAEKRTSDVRLGSIPRLCMTRRTCSFSFFDFRFCFRLSEISWMSPSFLERMAASDTADDEGCGSSACIQWCFWTIGKVKRLLVSRTSIFRIRDSQSANKISALRQFHLAIFSSKGSFNVWKYLRLLVASFLVIFVFWGPCFWRLLNRRPDAKKDCWNRPYDVISVWPLFAIHTETAYSVLWIVVKIFDFSHFLLSSPPFSNTL